MLAGLLGKTHMRASNRYHLAVNAKLNFIPSNRSTDFMDGWLVAAIHRKEYL